MGMRMAVGMLMGVLVGVAVGGAVGMGVFVGVFMGVGMAVPAIVAMLMARLAHVGMRSVVVVMIVGDVVFMHIFVIVLVIHLNLPFRSVFYVSDYTSLRDICQSRPVSPGNIPRTGFPIVNYAILNLRLPAL